MSPTLLKKITLIILILISSCNSSRIKSDLMFEQKFKHCADEVYNKLADRSYPIDTLLFQKANVHHLFENQLILDGYLEEISREGYSDLLDKNISAEFFKKFEKEIGFEPSLLFPVNSFINCYGTLNHRIELFDKNSWQFKFVFAFNQYEAYGMMELKSEYLKAVLMEIPEKKFKNIIYRKVFLDLIYSHYDLKIL